MQQYGNDSMRATAWRNLDLVLAAVWTLCLATIVLALPGVGPLRVVLGLPFVLFLPGYSLIAALYPREGDLDGVERLALSLGLSIAVVPLIGLGLNYTPWGIRLNPILVVLSVFILLMVAISLYRRRSLAVGQAFRLPFEAPVAEWRRSVRLDRVLAALLALAVVALGVSIYVAATRGTGERFTEFYILGPRGKAEGYPTQIAVGQPAAVTTGVIDDERRTTSYRIDVTVNGQTASVPVSVRLASKQKWEEPVRFTATQPGKHEEVQFLLYRAGDTQPYRQLHLWVDVT